MKAKDIKFLNNPRSQALGKEDSSYTKKYVAKLDRDTKEIEKQQLSSSQTVSPPQQKSDSMDFKSCLPRLRPRAKPVSGYLDGEDIDLCTEGDKIKTDDPNYVQSRFLRDRPKKKNIVSKNSAVLQAGDRWNLSSRVLASVSSAVLVDSGEDLNDHVFSHSTIHDNRRKMRSDTAL